MKTEEEKRDFLLLKKGLLLALNSRYGNYDHIESPLEIQKIITYKIDEINQKLENLKQ